MSSWSILIAALAQIILGSLWYGPFFGNSWMKMIGIRKPTNITPEIKRKMIGSYIGVFIGALLTAYILKVVLLQFPFASISGVSFVALLLWIGFIIPTQLGVWLWEGKPFKLYAIHIFYYLFSLVISAIILLKF